MLFTIIEYTAFQSHSSLHYNDWPPDSQFPWRDKRYRSALFSEKMACRQQFVYGAGREKVQPFKGRRFRAGEIAVRGFQLYSMPRWAPNRS